MKNCSTILKNKMFNNIISFWNKRPCNINHSNKKIGSKDYFDEVEKKKYFVEPHIPEFAEFKRWKGKKVFEVGCGIGTDAKRFCEEGADYTGIDISKNSIRIAEKRLQVYKLKGILGLVNIESSEFVFNYFNPNSYDLVYSFGVLHHTVNIRNAIRNIYKLLKPGGTFKFMVYAKHSLKNWKIMEGLDQYEAQKGVPIANVYTHADIRYLLQDFRNIDIVQTHIFPYKIPEYKKHRYVKQPYFEHMPKKLFDILSKKLGWHLCITCVK